jgi:hypothetical protein
MTAQHRRQSSRPCQLVRQSSLQRSLGSSPHRRQRYRTCSRRDRQSSQRFRLVRLSSSLRFRGSSRPCCRTRRSRLLFVC